MTAASAATLETSKAAFQALVRFWWLILSSCLFLLFAGSVYTGSQPDNITYFSSVKVKNAPPGIAANNISKEFSVLFVDGKNFEAWKQTDEDKSLAFEMIKQPRSPYGHASVMLNKSIDTEANSKFSTLIELKPYPEGYIEILVKGVAKETTLLEVVDYVAFTANNVSSELVKKINLIYRITTESQKEANEDRALLTERLINIAAFLQTFEETDGFFKIEDFEQVPHKKETAIHFFATLLAAGLLLGSFLALAASVFFKRE